jgi:ribosomal protein S18 acetylase RimI-like enzyme
MYNNNMLQTSSTFPPELRPIDARRDLDQIADLIELCFSSHMDQDGYEYLRQLRRAAADSSLTRWIPGAFERVSVPLHGYVWKENEKVIGNLSLIPFFVSGKWLYLIANVAVHPNYRRRGIARLLTQRALEHIREHGVPSAWLQVRDDNPAAHQLYLSLGFKERARRTTWLTIDPPTPIPRCPADITLAPRHSQDWLLQEEWLKNIYPQELAWNLNFDRQHFSPSLWRDFLNWINNVQIRHWTAHRDNQLTGTISWEPSLMFADHLWLTTHNFKDENTLIALLSRARAELKHNRRMLQVNFPAGCAEDAFWKSGFAPHVTLIWMEATLTP